LDITHFATLILTALPHDAVALACLAEVEHAHANTEFAVTYLRHVQLGQPAESAA
jgi:protein O-GlcNAc transferase